MKRREQIEKVATDYINSDAVSPMNMQLAFGDFINGAQWADKTMIEGLAEEETKPKPKFKVGDSVEVLKSGNTYTISQMAFNGKEFVYTLSNNGNTVCWFSEDEIIECKVEEEVGLVDNLSSRWVNEFNLPEGYQFKDENGNVINETKIVLEKKKKEYPKTYEECCKVMKCDPWFEMNTCYHGNELSHLYRLLICRDAYWKIAGEEMGLGKPWAPDWKNDEQFKYIIICRRGCIIKDTYTAKDVILSFPTEEMRDEFYENFKELIESCKELL